MRISGSRRLIEWCICWCPNRVGFFGSCIRNSYARLRLFFVVSFGSIFVRLGNPVAYFCILAAEVHVQSYTYSNRNIHVVQLPHTQSKSPDVDVTPVIGQRYVLAESRCQKIMHLTTRCRRCRDAVGYREGLPHRKLRVNGEVCERCMQISKAVGFWKPLMDDYRNGEGGSEICDMAVICLICA